MPSLNIKDYIIAILLLVIIGLGILTFYDKTRIGYLEDYKEKSEQLVEQQIHKIKLLKENSRKTEEYLNEKYEVELSMLNNTINGLRNNNTSLMPSIPESSEDPTRACFGRAELDEAIKEYRAGVQRLVGKGAKGIIESNICKEWILKESLIYE